MDLYTLLYHLKKCPEDFLQQDSRGFPLPEVLLRDVFRMISGDFNISNEALPYFVIEGLDENHQMSIKIGCWFFSHPFFLRKPELLVGVRNFMMGNLSMVNPHVKFREWLEDDDRAEEFVRRALFLCDIQPDGENRETSLIRLDALDTVKRQAVIQASAESYQRMQEIRRQMAERKAREAANVYGRE